MMPLSDYNEDWGCSTEFLQKPIRRHFDTKEDAYNYRKEVSDADSRGRWIGNKRPILDEFVYSPLARYHYKEKYVVVTIEVGCASA